MEAGRTARVQAVDGVSFSLAAGELVGVIGPNGAGKTTLSNLLVGVEQPDAGRVLLAGRDVTRQPQHTRAELGIGRTFQTPQLIGALSVLDNMLCAGRCGSQPSIIRALIGAGQGGNEGRALARARASLEMMQRRERLDHPSVAWSIGAQRLVELARSLAGGPRILLLDEPFSGLNGAERSRVIDLRDELRRGELGILLIEHDVPAVMRLADRVIALDQGRIVANGPPTPVHARHVDSSERRAEVTPQQRDELLAADTLHVTRGGVAVLRSVSMRVARGEIVTITGPNGAGKSTLLGALSGLHPTASGTTRFAGRVVDDMSPAARVRLGLVLVPERRQVFEPLTVLENLRVGAHWRTPTSIVRERRQRVLAGTRPTARVRDDHRDDRARHAHVCRQCRSDVRARSRRPAILTAAANHHLNRHM